MCTQAQLTQMLEQLAKQSRAVFGDKLKELILFGSYARGDFDAESDVDVVLLMDVPHEDETAYHKQMVQLLGDLYEQFGYATVVSPVIISASFFEEWKNDLPFYKALMNEGVRIVA